MNGKRLTAEERLRKERDYQAANKHHPACCLAKAIFGADCPRCDRLPVAQDQKEPA